jgi:hypothetical protein
MLRPGRSGRRSAYPLVHVGWPVTAWLGEKMRRATGRRWPTRGGGGDVAAGR